MTAVEFSGSVTEADLDDRHRAFVEWATPLGYRVAFARRSESILGTPVPIADETDTDVVTLLLLIRTVEVPDELLDYPNAWHTLPVDFEETT